MKKDSKKFTVPNAFKKDKSHFYATNSMLLPFPDGGKITVAPLSQNMNIAATRNLEVVGKDYLGNPLYNYNNQFDPSLKVGIEKFNILPGLGKKFVPLYGGLNVNVPYSDPSKAGVMGTMGFSGEGVGRHRTPVYGYGELQAGYSGDRGAEAGVKFGADIFLSRTPLNPKIYANDTYPRQTLVGKVSPHLRAGVVSGGNKDLSNNFTWAYGAQGELKYRFPKFPGVPYAKAFVDFDPAAGTEITKTQGDVGTVGNVEVQSGQNKSTLGFSPLVGGEVGMRFPINTYKNPAKEKAQAKAREFEEAEKARIRRELELKRYQQESQDGGGAGQIRTAKEMLAMQATPQLWWESPTGTAEGPAQEELRNVRGFTPTADFANGGYMYPDGGPMEKGAVENQAADFLTKMANSPLFTSRYNTMMKKEASPEEVNAFRQHMVDNINSVDYWPVGYEYTGKPWTDEFGVASYQPARDSFRGNYNILNISDEVNSPSRYTQGIYHPHTIFRKDASPTSTVHELSHASTVSDYMPAKVHVPYSKDPAKAESVAKYSSSNYNRSTEHKAYLDEVRKYLYDNKIYDATTKAFDETDYNNLLKTYENLKLELEKNPDNLELKYLLGAFNKSILPYDKEQNIQLFNSYVDNSSEKSELGNVNIAAYGGTLYSNGGMLKRADGSYSKRGLWDNIRANAGSGKAPTKEMLAQERKINSRQYPGGGQLGSGMLGQNIRQYQNAPKKPLVIDNPRLGPTKQSNQGNTATVIPNSKLPKTLNTVRNPEAEKKALEKQTRELVQSGAASRSLGTLGSSDKSLYEQTQAALLTDPNFLNKVEKNEYKYQQELEQKAYDDASYLQKGVNFGTAFLSNPITTGANLLEGYRPLMNQAEVLRDANNPQNVLMRNTGGLDNIFNAFNPGAYVANYNSNIKKGNYVDAAVDAADILLAPTALGAAGDLKDITKAGEKVSQYFTSKVPTKIGNLTRTPEPFKSELVQRNLNDLKFATEWAKQYGYKLPTESFEKIAQSDKLTDMTIRGLANRHNTFARGVSVENTFLQNLGKFTNDPKAAAEYMATHIPPDTSAGRAGLSKSHGLYTSNSLETAEGYTRNNGYIVRVKKPTYFVGNNRQEWLTDNDFNVTSTDEPLGIQKQSYYSTQPIRGLAEKDYYPRRENFIEQSLKALPEKLLQKLDRSFVNEYEFKSRNLGNALFNKEISRELYEQKEADLWKEYGPRIIELRLTEQNIFKTVQERTDKLRTLHGDALQRRIVTNPYAHYVFMDSVPGRKVLDVVSTKRITPETIKHTSRAHAGNYSHGLTMRSPGFDTTDYVTPFSFRERFGLGPVAQRTAQAKYNNAVANAQNFTLNWYYNGANLRPEVAQKIKALEQSPQDVPKNDFYPSNADLINPDNPMLADTRLDVTTGTKKDIQRLVRNNVIEPDYAKTVRQSFMGSDGLSVPHESFIAALVKTKGPLGIKNVHPDKVEDIMVHEYSGHSGQYLNTGFGPNWNNVLNQEGASYYEPNLSTEAGRFAGSVMRHPKDGTRAWFKAPAELHADLMVARKQVYNEMLNRGINPEISMHMLHNTNSYPEIADELLGKLDRRFFKKTATVAERRKLIGMLPALVGATGAAAYGLTEEQKKNLQSGTQFAYGGSLEGGRKTNLPEDNFMKGGRNIYDSVYASSLGDYYEQGGYLDNQSPVQNINSGVLTASELASRLNRLV